MKNYRKLTNIVFLQIVIIASVFLISLGVVSYNLMSKILLFINAMPNKIESICGCSSYFSIANHPLFFIGVSLSFLLIIIYTISFIYKIIKLKNITDRFVSISLNQKKKERSKKLCDVLEKVELKNEVVEIEMDKPLVFCYSFFRPRICISSRLVKNLDEKELEAVLLHEKMHIINKDTIKIFIVKSVEKIILFLPYFRSLTRKYFLYSELAADEHATGGFSDNTYLARALYKSIRMEENVVLRNDAISVSFFGVTTERISRLESSSDSFEKKINFRIFVLNIIFLLLIITSFSFFNTNFLFASSDTTVHECLKEKSIIYHECNSSSSYYCEMNNSEIDILLDPVCSDNVVVESGNRYFKL